LPFLHHSLRHLPVDILTFGKIARANDLKRL